jgi:hypothetical protein
MSRYLSQLIPMLIGRGGDTKGKEDGNGFKRQSPKNQVKNFRDWRAKDLYKLNLIG